MILYLAYTEKKKTTIQMHQVWDAARFIAAQREQFKEKGVIIGEATEQEYRDANWPKLRKA